jgi:GNAT superfamily N-acetyltransferase
MSVIVRPARLGDGAAIAEVWLGAAAYYADLDPAHFQVPRAVGLADGWEEQLGQDNGNRLRLVAEADGRVIGWLAAHIEPPAENAAVQLTREHYWTRLAVDALVVGRGHWRQGAGTRLLEAARPGELPAVPWSPAWTPTRTARSRCPSMKIAWATSAARSSSRSGSDHLMRRRWQVIQSRRSTAVTWLPASQSSPGVGLGRLVLGLPVLPDGTATAAHIGPIGAAADVADLA